MTSNFLFTCCHNTTLEENSQTTHNSAPRNIISKNKTCITLNSPKASLKNLSLLRSPKNSKVLNSSMNMNMVSTVDIAHLEKSNNVNYLQPVLDKSIKPSQYVIQPKVEKIAVPQYIWAPLIKTPKQNIHFTYKSPINPEHIAPALRMPEMEKAVEKKYIVSEFKEEETKISEEKPKENIIKFIPKKQIEESTADEKKQLVAYTHRKNHKLGGSKYTILSEGEMQSYLEQNSFNMQQSAVVFNIFNPTRSQLHKWSQVKSRKSSNRISMQFTSEQNNVLNEQNKEK